MARRLKVTDQFAMAKDETSKYTELMPDGRSAQFTFTMGVKSVITRPSKGYGLGAHGVIPSRVSPGPGGGDSSCRGLRRRRSKLGRCGAGGARRAWGHDALPHAPALAGPARHPRVSLRTAPVPANLPGICFCRPGAQSFYHYNGQQRWQVSAAGDVRNSYV